MAKVHPLPFAAASSSYVTSRRESFTIWMKSLVMQGNGFTVYDSNGDIIYRIDNYEKKGSNEVYLMDLRGRVLFTILRKLRIFGRWEGYNNTIDVDGSKSKPRFQVTKKGHVTLQSDNNAEASTCYKLEAMDGKSSAFKIIDCGGRGGGGGVKVVAEAKRKESSSGVVFGDDVLTLVVEPRVDHSLIMALVTVYGLMQHRL